MPRFMRWWGLFYMSLKPAVDVASSAKKAWPIVAWVTGGTVVSGTAIALWKMQVQVPGWWFAIVPVVLWLFWKGGEAWVRSAGPQIDMGDLRPDRQKSFYTITVTNTGQKEVTPRTILQSMDEIEGERRKLADHSMSIWETNRQTLHGSGEHVSIPVLATLIDPKDPTLTALGVFAHADSEKPTRLTEFMKQSHRRALCVAIAVDVGSGPESTRTEKAFILRPKDGTPDYDIEPVKRRHRI